MRIFTRSIFRQLRIDFGYLYFSRYLYVVFGVVAIGVIVAFTGSVSNARSAQADFVHQVSVFESHGVSLADALSAPLTVTRDGSMETIDNPLKYDYLNASRSVEAIQGTNMIGTALDLVTYIVLPLVLLILGANLAHYDRTSGTLKFRAARERWARITFAKVICILIVSAMAAGFVVAFSLLVSLAGSASVAAITRGIDYDLAASASVSPLPAKLAMTVLVSLFFGVTGYVIGAITRSTSWPMVFAAAVLFLVPFVSRWDPRNLLAVLGGRIYDFRGQFEMRPPIPLPVSTALFAMLAYFGAVALAVAIAARVSKPR